MAVIACGRFGNTLIENKSDSSRFPYSLFVFGIGGILAILSAMLITFDICKQHHHKSLYGEGATRQPPKRHIGDPYQPYPAYEEDYPSDYPYQKSRDEKPYISEKRNPYPVDYTDYRKPRDEKPYPFTEKRDPYPVVYNDYKSVRSFRSEPVYLEYDRPKRAYENGYTYLPRISRPYRSYRPINYTNDNGPYVVTVEY